MALYQFVWLLVYIAGHRLLLVSVLRLGHRRTTAELQTSLEEDCSECGENQMGQSHMISS